MKLFGYSGTKKILEITLIDERVIKRDLNKAQIAIGTPANGLPYLQLAQEIAMCGILISESDKEIEFAPPSQIKKVRIIFEEQKEA